MGARAVRSVRAHEENNNQSRRGSVSTESCDMKWDNAISAGPRDLLLKHCFRLSERSLIRELIILLSRARHTASALMIEEVGGGRGQGGSSVDGRRANNCEGETLYKDARRVIGGQGWIVMIGFSFFLQEDEFFIEMSRDFFGSAFFSDWSVFDFSFGIWD